MALLAGTCYDPSSAATKATSSLLALTALDTTNLRHTITAPANGIVMARLATCLHGAVDQPAVLLGVLDGSTVRGRQVPVIAGRPAGNASGKVGIECLFPITGLTPSNSYTLDAAYAVEAIIASTNIKYGGPNNTTSNDAWGGFCYEIWEAKNLLAAKMYDPSTAASHATSSLTAMTALDTTNLRNTFTTAASGPGSTSVLVRIRGGSYQGATGTPGVLFGVLDGSTVKGRVPHNLGGQSINGTATTTMQRAVNAAFVVTGLTANTSYTWDLAMSVDFVVASSTFRYGGPNNTTADDCWGGLAYEIWKA
jgi:hypothetical protein